MRQLAQKSASRTLANSLLGLLLLLTGQQSQAQAALTVFSDKAAFLAATGAASATGPLPPLGYVSSAKVGSVTISNTSGSADPSVSLGFGDWTPLLPGVDLAVGGFEDVNITLDAPTRAFGFDFAEHMTIPSEEGSLCGGGSGCVDSIFTVTLWLGGSPVGSFSFSAPNDVASFVGVSSTAAFDRVEIRESRTQGGLENDYFGQFYTGPAAEGMFHIGFSAFIPGNSIATPRPCLWRGPRGRVPRTLYERSDNRTFDPSGTTYKVRQQVTVVPSDLGNDNGIVRSTAQTNVNPTRLYASDALPTIDDADDDGIDEDCSLFHREYPPFVRGINITSDRISTQLVRVRLQGNAGTGAALFIGRVCDISWDFTIQIDTSTTPPRATIEGSRDEFPAYEVYVNGQTLHTHWPGPLPYGLDDLLKLCRPKQPIVPNTILVR